ncbi:serine hydrolase domain-containing protein [Cellulomonas citrea]|uniref:serine hydrolase domain-containing protein n=1 Tax=Cellulomonas citrea TaxID=1909423 RepID=UPI001359AF96|nr:serine hydrolase domain-containing protein [Cellulomonas citrea]
MTSTPTPSDARTAARLATLRAAAPYLREWLTTQVATRRTPGAQVCVRYAGEVVLDTAIGLADVTTGEPLSTDHLFRIASHSKTFTGTAVLQLVETGRLRLDDPVAQWVPELAGAELAKVTVRELLGHQGGVLRDGVDADYWQLIGDFPDREALLDWVRRDGKVYARNEHFKYSNLGYGLLGLVIEAVTGTSFAEHLATAVLAPLGLTRTGAEYDPARAEQYAAGHTSLLDGETTRETIDHVDTRALAAATGFYSTAHELSRYAQAHVMGDTTLLSDDSKRLMQRLETVVSPYGVEAGRYGVGMELVSVGERSFVGHSGGYPGHITRTFVDPTDGLVVCVLTNAVDGPAHELAVGLVHLIEVALHPGRGRGTGPSTPAEELPTVPAGVTGRFVDLWGRTDLVELGGRLVVLHPTTPDPLAGLEEVLITPEGLQVAAGPGFGSCGERIEVGPAGPDGPAWLRVGGMTSWPVERFLERRTAMTRLPRVSV